MDDLDQVTNNIFVKIEILEDAGPDADDPEYVHYKTALSYSAGLPLAVVATILQSVLDALADDL